MIRWFVEAIIDAAWFTFLVAFVIFAVMVAYAGGVMIWALLGRTPLAAISIAIGATFLLFLGLITLDELVV